MPWRSRSFTIEAESSKVRSVNSGVSCGAVTRRIRKAKKPTIATVTAPIAPIRAAPGKICLVCGYWAVNAVGSLAPAAKERANRPALRVGTLTDTAYPLLCQIAPVRRIRRRGRLARLLLLGLPSVESLGRRRRERSNQRKRDQCHRERLTHLHLLFGLVRKPSALLFAGSYCLALRPQYGRHIAVRQYSVSQLIVKEFLVNITSLCGGRSC